MPLGNGHDLSDQSQLSPIAYDQVAELCKEQASHRTSYVSSRPQAYKSHGWPTRNRESCAGVTLTIAPHALMVMGWTVVDAVAGVPDLHLDLDRQYVCICIFFCSTWVWR